MEDERGSRTQKNNKKKKKERKEKKKKNKNKKKGRKRNATQEGKWASEVVRGQEYE